MLRRRSRGTAWLDLKLTSAVCQMHPSLRPWLLALPLLGACNVVAGRRVENLAAFANKQGLGDRCPSQGAECTTCLKQKQVGCAFDFKTNSCCKLRIGGLLGKFIGSRRTSCASALLAREPETCQVQEKLANLDLKARLVLQPSAEDIERCQEELEQRDFRMTKSRSAPSLLTGNDVPKQSDSVPSIASNLSKPVSLSKDGMQSCVSALLRSAILTDLKPRRHELGTQNCNIGSEATSRSASPALSPPASPRTASPRAASPNTSIPSAKGKAHAMSYLCCMVRGAHDHTKTVPCSVNMPAVNGQPHMEPVPPDMGFRAIRGMVPGISEKLRASLRSGPLLPKKFDAGKSESTFMTTADGGFILKAVRTDSQEEDRSLLKLLSGYKGRNPLVHYLQERKRKGSFTLVNLILGMYEVELFDMKRTFIVMEDAAMGLGNGQENCKTRTYDLKGASRAEVPLTEANETKKERQNVEFKKYEGNTFGLPEETCVHLKDVLQDDGAFLEEHHQIDYSVFARFGKSTASKGDGCATAGCSESRINCFRTASGETLVLSLIDYLNKFNTRKKFESVSGKFYNYAQKISDFVVSACSESLNSSWTTGSKKQLSIE